MQNLRPFPLVVPEAADPSTWIAFQSPDIQRTTYVDTGAGGHRLMQKPVVHPEAFVDPRATLIGGMILDKGCYVGPGAVIRLDEKPGPEPLLVGEFTNIQDHAVVHSTTVQIGRRVIVAHHSIVHGCRVEDDVTIYIQATADGGGTVLGKGCFLHRGAYVGKGIQIHPGTYVAPGANILSQTEADALPQVPDALKAVRAHVMELNEVHYKRYLEI